MADDREEIGRTLERLSRVHKTPKGLLKAVREAHPKARKKDVARAAFSLMIANSDSVEALALHDVAMTIRAESD